MGRGMWVAQAYSCLLRSLRICCPRHGWCSLRFGSGFLRVGHDFRSVGIQCPGLGGEPPPRAAGCSRFVHGTACVGSLRPRECSREEAWSLGSRFSRWAVAGGIARRCPALTRAAAVGPRIIGHYLTALGGLDLTGKAAVLKTAGSNPLGVRISRPPLDLRDSVFSQTGLVGKVLGKV